MIGGIHLASLIPGSTAQISFAHARIVREFACWSFEHNAPYLQHIGTIGGRERKHRVLLHDQDQTGLANAPDLFVNLFGEPRRQAERWPLFSFDLARGLAESIRLQRTGPVES